MIAVDPVEAVEESVGAHEHHVDEDNSVRLGFCREAQLGEHHDCLKEDGECPQKFYYCHFIIPPSRHGRAQDEGGDPESVQSPGVGAWEDQADQKSGEDGDADEEQFGEAVVEADIVCEEVKVSGDEDEEVENLGLDGDAAAGSGDYNLHWQSE